MNGDGLMEHVPRRDKTGPRAPERSYDLFSSGSPTKAPDATGRFFFGGNVYEAWSRVPDRFKTLDYTKSDPGRLKVEIFSFKF